MKPRNHGRHHDLDLKSAYVHVVAYAATSVVAIAALLGGLLWGWAWLDLAMGIVGPVVVALWAKRLIADTSKLLLDREMDHPVIDELREVMATQGRDGGTQPSDIHFWRVGKPNFACALSDLSLSGNQTASSGRRWRVGCSNGSAGHRHRRGLDWAGCRGCGRTAGAIASCAE
jgi:Co/Zn/Cd efflux system component